MIAMNQKKRRVTKYVVAGIAGVLLLAFLIRCSLDPLSGFDLRYGLCESNFNLAGESRLPRWFQAPNGTERSDIGVQFVYFLWKAKIAATNNKTGEMFFSAVADMKHHPITEAESKKLKQGSPCPWYYIISVDGVAEVAAHFEHGNIVYIVEPSEVTQDVYSNAAMKKRCETLKYFE
jgi:hypothetical protein